MSKEKLSAFFTEYQKAFVQGNLDKIGEFFIYPCIIEKTPGDFTSFMASDVLKTFEKVPVDYFASIHVKSADFEIVAVSNFAGNNVVCETIFNLYGVGGALLGKVRWVYHMQDVNGTLKILTAHFVP